MNRLVYTVFKTIMLAIIFVFVFDMAFYLYRALSLNARMESLSTSLKKVVMENNYLPKEDAELYQDLLYQMVADFNGVTYNPVSNSFTGASSDQFISGMHWNFSSDAVISDPLQLTGTVNQFNATSGTWTSVSKQLVHKKMNQPADYGDIMIVQLRVGVYQPLWNWGTGGSTTDYKYTGQSADSWTRYGQARSTEFVYTYYVPCLRYKTTSF